MFAFRLIVMALLASTLHAVSTDPTVPRPAVLAYITRELVGLTHFNMATFVGQGDPACNPSNWPKSSNASLFWPTNFSVPNWVSSYLRLGVYQAVLTAKHGCGFILFQTFVRIPPFGPPYRYGVGRPYAYPRDVAAEFPYIVAEAGLGHGFYYSIPQNFLCNRVNGHKAAPHLLPGMANVTDEEWHDIIETQLKELWCGRHGNMTEVWFDGGYLSLRPRLQPIVDRCLSEASIGYNGEGLTPSFIRRVQTESGLPTGPLWMYDEGPNASSPAGGTGCDITLQVNQTWFWAKDVPLRPLSELAAVYDRCVGNGGTVEMDFAIDQRGRVDPDHAAGYRALGGWIRKCYGRAVGAASYLTPAERVAAAIPPPSPATVAGRSPAALVAEARYDLGHSLPRLQRAIRAGVGAGVWMDGRAERAAAFDCGREPECTADVSVGEVTERMMLTNHGVGYIAPGATNVTVKVPKGMIVDRVMAREDISKGQLIRRWTVTVVKGDAVVAATAWTAIGGKAILHLPQAVEGPAEVTATILNWVPDAHGGGPHMSYFGVFEAALCEFMG